MPDIDVEAELSRHPRVSECVITSIPTGPTSTALVAYVVTSGPVDAEELRTFLSRSGLPADRVPQAVIPLDSLPRTPSGEVDRAGLPLPVIAGPAAGGKEGLVDLDDRRTRVWAIVITAAVAAVTAGLSTDTLWPGSTDLSSVPPPWTDLFRGLYLAEALSCGLGLGFLLFGRRLLAERGGSPVLIGLTHLSIVWLLVAWWPQDNLYRLADKTDWPRQAGLVYSFNITLMLAAAVLVVFVCTGRRAR